MSSLSLIIRRALVPIASGFLLVAGSILLQASDSGRLPPPPLPIPSAPPGGSAPPPGSAPASALPSGQAPGAGFSAVNTQDLTVLPGAAEDKRKALLGRIMEAKSQGIGISTYMMAFDALEQSAKAGESEENVVKRVTSLNGSLDEQFKRSAMLKIQRPAPPIAASAPTLPLGSGGGAPAGNSDTASLIQKLQSKYGNQIPDNLKDKIPAGTDPSQLLKNPDIQDLLKGLKNK